LGSDGVSLHPISFMSQNDAPFVSYFEDDVLAKMMDLVHGFSSHKDPFMKWLVKDSSF
jgi:hypothetical protein